ncbi:hypothetical protein A4U88_5166 [Serratia marcescens]|nr:hypothetical protein A4U88_5166 [Serratia marcescens]
MTCPRYCSGCEIPPGAVAGLLKQQPFIYLSVAGKVSSL